LASAIVTACADRTYAQQFSGALSRRIAPGVSRDQRITACQPGMQRGEVLARLLSCWLLYADR